MTPDMLSSYVADLSMQSLLECFETWLLLDHGAFRAPESVLLTAPEWVAACRHEIVRRCGEHVLSGSR